MNIEIILEIILIFIGLYLALFKSYFQEKGKNIATSEDIEELTVKVESAKQQFLEKNANLKAKLDLLTNLQINHKNDERLALINFHKKIKNWIGLFAQPSPSLVNDYDNEEIQTKLHFYDSAYQEVLSAEALLELYVDDYKLLELILDLKIETSKNLVIHTIEFLHNLKDINIEIKYLESEQNLEKRVEKHKELLCKRSVLFDEHGEKIMDGLKINLPFESEYKEYIRGYMEKIYNE